MSRTCIFHVLLEKYRRKFLVTAVNHLVTGNFYLVASWSPYKWLPQKCFCGKLSGFSIF